jgi:hypothetical protein
MAERKRFDEILRECLQTLQAFNGRMKEPPTLGHGAVDRGTSTAGSSAPNSA